MTSVASAYEAAYNDLCRLARTRLAREQFPISTGTLVHELYLDMQQRPAPAFNSREEFLAYAARAMRSLLVDMARERKAKKRHAELLPLTLGHDVADRGSGTPEQLLALNDAIERLGRLEPRLLRVAEMRAILGLEISDIALALKLSEATVKRDWQRCKAFLHEALGAS